MGNVTSLALTGPEWLQEPRKVRLVVTPLGMKVPGVGQAHHTSIFLEGIEYSFSNLGIVSAKGIQSHAKMKGPKEVIEMGVTTKPGRTMKAHLDDFFPKGSYDLLRKNCNSFSECGLHYLLGIHLDDKYKVLEKIGRTMDRYTGVINKFTGGAYRKNPEADNFQTVMVEAAVLKRK